MAKMPYSLILSEEIVAEIDLRAAEQGVSRSALINHILGEYVSLAPPEKRSRDILTMTEQLLAHLGLRASITGGGTLVLRTALRYKYNPQLSYMVELYADDSSDIMGELRVVLRSQNDALLAYMRLFFQLWQAMEQRHLPTPPPDGCYTITPRRFGRLLRYPGIPQRAIGTYLAAYVNLMDECMKEFFAAIENPERALAATERCYQKGLTRLEAAGCAL